MLGAHFGNQAISLIKHGLVSFVQSATHRDFRATIFIDHRQGSLRQIAQIISKISIHAADDYIMAIAAIIAIRHFAHEEITHRVNAVSFDQI